APVVAAAGGFDGAGQRGADHDRVGAAGQRFSDVAAAGHPAVRDDVDVAAPGLVEVVPPGRGDVADRGRHGHGHPQHAAGGVPRPAAETDEHPRSTGAHEVQGGGVGGASPDHDGNVEVVDELLEVEGLRAAGDVFGGDRGAADDENVHPGLDHGLVVLGRALGGEAGRGDYPGAADLFDPAADQFFFDRF